MSTFPLLDRLNPAQRSAVTSGDGHLCINAAAGTGKTSTVAARILYLQLERRVSPNAILAVSFSRAARGNLLQRVEDYIGYLGRGSNVTTLTLHGLAYRVMRLAAQQGETWLKPGFDVVYGGRDRMNPVFEEIGPKLVDGLVDGYPPSVRPQLYAKALDLIRQGHPGLEGAVVEPGDLDQLRSATIAVDWDLGSRSSVQLGHLQTVWKRYYQVLRRRNSIDYPGMLTECLRVLWAEGPTLTEFQQGLRYLIVDEYQDTSRAQEELIRLLAGDNAVVTVVGDTDQAIYTFNGSDPENLRRFSGQVAKGSLPVLPPVNLTWNYRSTTNILSVANRVLEVAGQSHKLETAPDGMSAEIAEYRQRNLPVIRVRARELGHAARWVAAEIRRLITDESVQPHEIAVLVRKDTEHSPQGALVRKALDEIGMPSQVQDRDPQRTALVLDVMHTLLNDQIGQSLEEVVACVQSGGWDGRLGGITRDEARRVLEEARRAGATTALDAADLVYDMGAPEQTEPVLTGVQVRTIHSAKGLEFRVVFLMYLGDKQFPSGSRPNIAEERRLFYVGITRAQERLYVLGRPGVIFPSFFDEAGGLGTELVHAEPDDQVKNGHEVSDEVRGQVEAARERQRQLDAERKRQS